MIENREFIKLTCGDLRTDLELLFKTFDWTYDDITPQEEDIWDGAVVHVINQIPDDEYDKKYEPRYMGSICRYRKKEELMRLTHDILIIGEEFIDVYRFGFWALLIWKTWNYHKSKCIDLRTFYLKDYEIYIHGGDPTEEEEWHGWNGQPSYYYNFDLAIDESFTIMKWQEAQDFVNKLIKEYDWFWYIK